MKDLRLTLKVCEGCGALWLRAPETGVYCRRCTAVFEDFPSAKGRTRRGRRPKATAVVVSPAGVRAGR